MSMKILADENMPLARELFEPLGELTLVPGREVNERFPGLEKYDALAIRSVTEVTPALVDKAVNCRFIGTATIGTDHIDLKYIEQANRRRRNPIQVAYAPGSNADSVADYVWHAILYLTRDDRQPLRGRTLGIVGYGNCGSRVARRAEGFGLKVLRNDPPLAERDPQFVSDPLEETLAADFVTLHVPLTRKGESSYPTYHMIGAAELGRMSSGARLLNTSRGAVIDSAALIKALRQERLAATVLDVFEGEPVPHEDLIRLPTLATPHIAGYAIEAKNRGTVVIYEALCRCFGLKPVDTAGLMRAGFNPPRGVPVEFPSYEDLDLQADEAVRTLFGRIYDIEATSEELKATVGRPDRGRLFDQLRKDYDRRHGRHELAAYRVGFDASVGPQLRSAIMKRLAGFGILEEPNAPHFVLRLRPERG